MLTKRFHIGWLFLVAIPLWGQTGSLSGRVSDQSGAIVPGATVTLSGTEGVKTVKSGADGLYSFAGLPAGAYEVLASAPSLVMPRPAKISLRSGAQTLNLQLNVAAATQQMTIQENAGPGVSTEASNNASATVLRGEDLQALSDDPDDLQADLQALAGPSAGPNGGAIFIDGFSGGQLPPKESIREIRINQNPFSPEYDKLGYGRIEIFTKPGSDRFHGTIAYNFADDIWNSRNPYAAQKAPLVLNESENSFSGPINKRASFTLDIERQSVDNGAIINGVLLDPQTFADSPFTGISRTPQRRFRVSPHVDYQLNGNNTLSFRYTFTHSDIRDAGIGGFDLISRGFHRQNTFHTAQVTETAVLGPRVVNETRFQYFRSANSFIANDPSAEIQVLGAFNSGGAQVGHSADTQNNFELQNYTTVLRGKHTWRFGVRMRGDTDDNVSQQNFGGTFTFSSLNSYRITLLGLQSALTPDQIRSQGGGASQFTINTGLPEIAVHQVDAGIFAGDDWRLRPNLTLNLGVRYETQTNIRDRSDIAPRVGIAWAVGAGKNRPSKTVLRAGFGIFYDRFALANSLTAQRFNGIVQQQYVITNPDYPSIPALGGNQSNPLIQEVASNFRSPYIMQSALTLERQLPRHTTIAVTYTNSRGLHVLRSQDINAPLPGTYDPSQKESGVYPYGTRAPIFLMTSSGVYNQNQLITNVNSKFNSQISMFGFYVWNRAMSNSDGLGTFPANPYNFAGEYGPAATDVRHRFLVGGSVNTRWNLRMSPFIIVQSGPPFDITTGRDLYGTTLFNTRPGIPADPSKLGVLQTPYGLLDPNPSPDERLLPRNFGRGPGMITVNLRVGKSFGFGPERESGAVRSSGDARPAGGSPLTSPGGMRGLFSPPSTSHRYNLTISMSGRNLLNHNNPGPIIGNIMSPLFGRANQVAGAPNGEGFSENASNRRLELQCRFTF